MRYLLFLRAEECVLKYSNLENNSGYMWASNSTSTPNATSQLQSKVADY